MGVRVRVRVRVRVCVQSLTHSQYGSRLKTLPFVVLCCLKSEMFGSFTLQIIRYDLKVFFPEAEEVLVLQ